MSTREDPAETAEWEAAKGGDCTICGHDRDDHSRSLVSGVCLEACDCPGFVGIRRANPSRRTRA